MEAQATAAPDPPKRRRGKLDGESILLPGRAVEPLLILIEVFKIERRIARLRFVSGEVRAARMRDIKSGLHVASCELISDFADQLEAAIAG